MLPPEKIMFHFEIGQAKLSLSPETETTWIQLPNLDDLWCHSRKQTTSCCTHCETKARQWVCSSLLWRTIPSAGIKLNCRLISDWLHANISKLTVVRTRKCEIHIFGKTNTCLARSSKDCCGTALYIWTTSSVTSPASWWKSSINVRKALFTVSQTAYKRVLHLLSNPPAIFSCICLKRDQDNIFFPNNKPLQFLDR